MPQNELLAVLSMSFEIVCRHSKKVAYFLHKAVLHYKIIPELYAVVCTKFTFTCVHTAVLQV
jgi:hypothetical protein